MFKCLGCTEGLLPTSDNYHISDELYKYAIKGKAIPCMDFRRLCTNRIFL